ncbi:MAG: DUF1292 domain-containing protein [Bacilli bacterium]|nr:DUF1292 domain-containing protein [Bacilli bacterium]
MDRKVTITNSQGQKAIADIVTIFRVNDLNSEYVVYTFNQKDQNNNIKDYASKLRVENGVYYFDSIEDENEWERVKSIIIELGKGGA